MSIARPDFRRLVGHAIVLLVVSTCSTVEASSRWDANAAAFADEMQDLRKALAIPGLAYAIVEGGRTIATGAFGVEQGSAGTPFTTSTPLRIASVTKSLTAVVALQLVEEGRLDLEAPVRRYAPALKLPDDVRVRHLLTHTSEGLVGAEYVYGTNRYAMLKDVIEAVTREELGEVVRRRVLERAHMRAHPSPFLGAHAGLVSTTLDMAAYLQALDRGRLLTPASLARLETPSRSTAGAPLPVSLGWFAQSVQGQPVVWSFGQDDPEHSGALLVRVPSRRLSLFLLANANVVSDPFRLLMGDVTKSPFAMSFLRLFAFSPPGTPLGRPPRDDAALADRLEALEGRSAYRYRDELLGWMLIDLWNGAGESAQRKHGIARSRYPSEVPDAVVHFAALRLPDVRSHDDAIGEGGRLLAAHPMNRWMLLAQGYLLQERGRATEASGCFQRILDLPNQEPDALRRLFLAWSHFALAQMSAERDPPKARAHLEEIVRSGVTGGMLEDARRLLDSLGQRPAQ